MFDMVKYICGSMYTGLPILYIMSDSASMNTFSSLSVPTYFASIVLTSGVTTVVRSMTINVQVLGKF